MAGLAWAEVCDSDENLFESRIEDVGGGLRATGEGLGFKRGEGHDEEYSKGVGEGKGDGEGEGEFISLRHSRGVQARARDQLVGDLQGCQRVRPSESRVCPSVSVGHASRPSD